MHEQKYHLSMVLATIIEVQKKTTDKFLLCRWKAGMLFVPNLTENYTGPNET
jgi:hypothetical protein